MKKSPLPFVYFCACLWFAPTNATIAADESTPSSLPVNPVIEWNRTLLVIVRTPGAQPATLHSTRSFAMLHAAIFDAVINSAGPHAIHRPNVPPDETAWAAAHQAAHDVLVALYPAQQVMLDEILQQDLLAIPTGAAKLAGMEAGHGAAAQIIAARSTDGSSL